MVPDVGRTEPKQESGKTGRLVATMNSLIHQLLMQNKKKSSFCKSILKLVIIIIICYTSPFLKFKNNPYYYNLFKKHVENI